MQARVSVIQAGASLFDTPRTLERLAALAECASRQGSQWALFPEAFLGGYPKGIDFGVRIGSRSAEGRDWFRRYAEAAITIPGPETDRLCRIASTLGLSMGVGVIEREGSTLYCTVVFVGSQGTLLGKHRKIMPTAAERLVWGMGDGSTLPVVETPVGRIGAAICWENYMPLLRTALYAQDLQIYCAPTVDDRETWLPTLRHIAIEGRCFVLSACQFLKRSDCPPDYDPIQGQAPDTVLIHGGSAIIDPFGTVLAGPCFDQETVLTAEIDLDDILRARFDLDVTGHYARPDLFQLTLDTRPRTTLDRR